MLKSKHWKWLHEFIPAINVESATDGKEAGSATANDGAKATPPTAADVGRSCKLSSSLFYGEKIFMEIIEKKAKTEKKVPKTEVILAMPRPSRVYLIFLSTSICPFKTTSVCMKQLKYQSYCSFVIRTKDMLNSRHMNIFSGFPCRIS